MKAIYRDIYHELIVKILTDKLSLTKGYINQCLNGHRPNSIANEVRTHYERLESELQEFITRHTCKHEVH